MTTYEIRYTLRFDHELAAIEASVEAWGAAMTERYVSEIIARCEALRIWPRRFERVAFASGDCRAFRHKAHRVFYRVDDATGRAYVLSILPARSNLAERL